MARYARSIQINAPISDVWAALVELETWPSWAAQFKKLERIESRPLALGSRVRVRPKGLPTSVWTVTEFEEGKLFTWASTLLPGARLIGGHELASDGDGTTAEFWLDATGPLGRLLGPILRRTTFSRNTRNATEGLKKHLER